MSYKRIITISVLTLIILIIGASFIEEPKEVGVQGLIEENIQIEDEPQYYDEESEEMEFTEWKDETDLMMTLDEWKVYEEVQYIPELENKFKGEDNTDKLIKIELKNLESIESIIEYLNPNNISGNRVIIEGLMAYYGFTQINVKLIPLAVLHYPDFEINEKSQVNFLKDYIKIKQSNGYNLDDILNQYKYNDYP